MSQKDYPYQNLALENIEGESWEDLPGLDGYYRISSFGRVKRLQYEMQYRNGAIYVKPEKIIKPGIVKGANKFKKDYSHFLTMRVVFSGKRYNMTIARMVYYCFVKPFDLEDINTVVICRDTDNYNICPANIELVTYSQKQQRIVERKRFKSPFLNMTKEVQLVRLNAMLAELSKEVSQYCLNGIKINTFSSAAAAERATKVFAVSIGNVASGKSISAGGFIWRWGKEDTVDIVAVRQERRAAFIEKRGQKVTQYDLKGKKIAEFNCIKNAAEQSKCSGDAILKVLKGEYKSSKGFFWTKGFGSDHIDLSLHTSGKGSMAMNHFKRVDQFTLEGKYIQTFDSIKNAAKSLNVTSSTISAVVKGRQHTCKGFKLGYTKPS